MGEGELAEVLAGPTGLTERANTFDQGAVLREFAAAAPQGSRVDTVRAQVGRFIGRDDVLATRRQDVHERGARRTRSRADRRGSRPPGRRRRATRRGRDRAGDPSAATAC